MERDELYNEKFKNIDKQLCNHEERISDTEDKMYALDKSFEVSFTKTSAALEKLAELPNAIHSMQKTNEEVNISLVQLSGKVD